MEKNPQVQLIPNNKRSVVTIHVSQAGNDWHFHLESGLKLGDDVDVIGLDCDADKKDCKKLADKHGYHYDCSKQFSPNYGRFRNKKFHLNPPSELSTIPPNFPIPKKSVKRTNLPT